MLYRTKYRVECYHKPSDTWPVIFGGTYGVRAVSVRHALNKMLRVVARMPGYADRVNHEDWAVTATVSDITLAENQ